MQTTFIYSVIMLRQCDMHSAGLLNGVLQRTSLHTNEYYEYHQTYIYAASIWLEFFHAMYAVVPVLLL